MIAGIGLSDGHQNFTLRWIVAEIGKRIPHILVLELILLLAAIFGAGFVAGFAVRAYISHQRRKRARDQNSNSFTSQINPVSDAPFMSPAMPEIPIMENQSKPHRTPAAPSQRAR